MIRRKPSDTGLRHLDPGLRRDERKGAAIVTLAALLATSAIAAPVAVTVQDKGAATLCAEEDNVYAVLTAPGVRRFEVQARQPVYGAGLTSQLQTPDFTHCSISAAHDFKFKPRTVTLYEDAKVKVVGVTYPGYWRPERVKVTVAGRADAGFHLLQLFVKAGGTMQEVVVLHAADGYWRLRPLPLPQFKGAVYGSSFLVGPIEEAGRPFVRIREVRIDPVAMTFRLLFALGGQARLAVTRVDHDALTMTVALDPAVAASRPFVALRSMYVAPDNADTAELAWTAQDGQERSAPAVGFGKITATAAGFIRTQPSRHNTAAPDILFSRFDDSAAAQSR